MHGHKNDVSVWTFLPDRKVLSPDRKAQALNLRILVRMLFELSLKPQRVVRGKIPQNQGMSYFIRSPSFPTHNSQKK